MISVATITQINLEGARTRLPPRQESRPARPNHRYRLEHAGHERQNQGIGQTDEQIGNQRHDANSQAKDALSGNVVANLAIDVRNQFRDGFALVLGNEK